MSSGFHAHQYLPGLTAFLPYPEDPLRLSAKLQEQVAKAPFVEGSTYKKCLVTLDDSEGIFIWKYCEADKSSKWRVKRISVIEQKENITIFKKSFVSLEKAAEEFPRQPITDSRRVENLTKWREMTDSYRVKVKKRLLNKVRVVPVIHGSSAEKCHSICGEIGFTHFGKHNELRGIPGSSTDAGYIGSGCYFTTSMEYAVKYAKRHLIFAFVAVTEPYIALKEDMETLRGGERFDHHDAHYALVGDAGDPSGKIFYPSDTPTYDELVVFGDRTQALARFSVEIEEERPFSVANYPKLGDELLQILLEHPHQQILEGDPVLEQLQQLIETKKKVETLAPVSLSDRIAYLFSSVIFDRVPELKDWVEACNAPLVEDTLTPATPRASLKELLRKLALACHIASGAPFHVIDQLFEKLPEDRAYLREVLSLLDIHHLRGTLSCPSKEIDFENLRHLVFGPLSFFLQRKENNPEFQPTSLAEMAIEEILGSEADPLTFIPRVEHLVKHLQDAPLTQHKKLYKMLSTKIAFEPLREAYLNALPEGPIADQLALIPNIDGRRISAAKEIAKLRAQIEAITQTEPTSVAVKSSFFSEIRYLKQDLISNYMEGNNLKKEYSSALHNVCHIQSEGVNLHLKQKPSPMKEYVAYSLAARICGGGIPPSELLRFEVGRVSYPVLASQTVEGTPLNEKETFSSESLTHMSLLSLLLCPGDWKRLNGVVDDRNRVHFVDNEDILVEPIVREYGMKTVKFSSILFCLSPWYLHPGAVELWTKLFPEHLFPSWMQDLKEREAAYVALFPDDKEREKLYTEDSNNKFTPYLLLREGTMATFCAQLHVIQQELAKIRPEETLGSDLLKWIVTLRGEENRANPLGEQLAAYYSKAKGATPSNKLQAVLGKRTEASMTSSQSFKASLGTIPTAEEIEKKKFFSLKEQEEELAAYTLLSASGALVTIKNDRICLEVDFEKITPERQQLFLKGLSHYTHKGKRPNSISLLNASALTPGLLASFLHPNLTHLNLSRSGLTSFPSELQQCQALKELYLSGSSQLISFKNPNLFASSFKFSSLEILHIANCQSLTTLRLEARGLKELKASHNPHLSELFVRPNLETVFQLEGSPKVSLEEVTLKHFPLFNKHRFLEEELKVDFRAAVCLYLALLYGKFEFRYEEEWKNGLPLLRLFDKETISRTIVSLIEDKIKWHSPFGWSPEKFPYDEGGVTGNQLCINHMGFGVQEAEAFISLLPWLPKVTCLKFTGYYGEGASIAKLVKDSSITKLIFPWRPESRRLRELHSLMIKGSLKSIVFGDSDEVDSASKLLPMIREAKLAEDKYVEIRDTDSTFPVI